MFLAAKTHHSVRITFQYDTWHKSAFIVFSHSSTDMLAFLHACYSPHTSHRQYFQSEAIITEPRHLSFRMAMRFYNLSYIFTCAASSAILKVLTAMDLSLPKLYSFSSGLLTPQLLHTSHISPISRTCLLHIAVNNWKGSENSLLRLQGLRPS